MKVVDSLLRFIGVNVEPDEEFEEELEEETTLEEKATYRGREREQDYSYRGRYSSRADYGNNYGASSAQERATAPVQVVLVKAKRFTEVERIAENIKSRRSVIINFEEMDREEAQRTVDFLSGATFAMSGSVQKISKSTFVFAVGQVDLVGRIEEISREHEGFFAGF